MYGKCLRCDKPSTIKVYYKSKNITEKRFMLDDAGELIDKENAQFIEYGEKVCDLLNKITEENGQLKQRITELELLNDGLNYALQNIKKIDVEIDLND